MKRISKFILLFALLILFAGCATTSAFHNAAYRGDINAVKVWLDQGANVNEKTGISDLTPLYLAIAKGHTEIVKLLLDKGADVELVSSGATPLVWAAEFGHIDTARLLVERGANLERALIKCESDRNKDSCRNLLKMIIAEKEKPAKTQVAAVLKPLVETPPSVKSDVDELPPIKSKPNKNAYAIVIGIEHYRQKLPKADFATQDAKIMTEYLTKVMGYPEENVVTLLNDRASMSDITKYFEKWLSNNVEKDGTVFIYYSGHGAPNPKTGDAYLVPYDGDPTFIDQTGYSLKRLYESLGKLQAKEIIVALDSCFSGAGGRSVLAKGARPLVMNLEGSMILSQKIAVLAAASGDQVSSTYDEKGHGLFTYFMLRGIKEGITDLESLYNFLKPNVEKTARKMYNNEQSPQLIAPKEKQKMLLLEKTK